MYMLDNFIEMGLENGQKWTTPFHRTVAVICLICNPRIFTKEKLVHNVKIINSLDNGYLQNATVGDLLNKGCDFI